MDERLVIIDLHCDPTMPAGAKEAGGGNVYMRQLLQCLGSTDLRVTYITRKKYQELDYFSIFYDKIDFFRLELGDWGPDDKSILQNHYGDAICQIRNILNQYGNCSLVFHSSYWQSGKLALALSGEYNTYFVHTVLSNALRKQLRGESMMTPPNVSHGRKKCLAMRSMFFVLLNPRQKISRYYTEFHRKIF